MMVDQVQQVGFDEEGNIVSKIDKDVAVGSAIALFTADHAAKTLVTMGTDTPETTDKVHLTNVQIYNKEVTETVYKFLDNATQKMVQYPVAAGKVLVISKDDLDGYVFSTSVICDPDAWTVGSEVSIGYWIEPAVVE